MGQIKDQQNVFDATLQGYGTLEELVKFAFDNDLLLDELPTVGAEWVIFPGFGDSAVQEFIVSRNFSYNNGGVEAKAHILANSDLDILAADAGVQFIYK
ncbi:MAG: hypothetical protein KAS70_08340 [Planctomycetes bacterium]|nr:hypothetical protein [Planctomycetota bacterium]